jgi:hypothetical protein
MVRLATPLVARMMVRGILKEQPGLSAEQILAKVREEVGPNPGEAESRLIEAIRARLPSGAAQEDGDSAAPLEWYSPSSLALVAANLLPLWGVLAWGWPVFPLLVLFWLENVVVGLLTALRMLLADPGDIALWAAKLFMVPFFCLHYGIFTAVHGGLVFGIFGGKEYGRLDHGWFPIHSAMHAIKQYGLELPLAALAGSHLFSFCWDYILRGGYRRTALTELMGQPYSRVFVLHVTIIFGGWAVMLLGSPLWALVLLLAIKTAIDLKAHLRLHAKK